MCIALLYLVSSLLTFVPVQNVQDNLINITLIEFDKILANICTNCLNTKNATFIRCITRRSIKAAEGTQKEDARFYAHSILVI